MSGRIVWLIIFMILCRALGFLCKASRLTPPDSELGLKIMRDDDDVADGKYLSLLIKKRTRTQAMLVAVDAYCPCRYCFRGGQSLPAAG